MSTMANTLAAVREMTAEVAELNQAAEQPLTDTLAQFLAAQYVLAAKAAVRAAGGQPLDLKSLRPLCGDVAALRRGDQNAERLRIEREWLSTEYRWLLQAKEDSHEKWKKKIITGLETLQRYVYTHHPKAKAAFETLAAEVRGPFDSMEPDPGEQKAPHEPAAQGRGDGDPAQSD